MLKGCFPMTARTRYFVIASLLVLAVGVGTGLLAYYVGVPHGFLADRDGPVELLFVPRDVAVLAYADVREIMTSDIRQKIHRAVPLPGNGEARFQDETGINIETDIDRIVASIQPMADGTVSHVVVARGRFNDVKIEALMREHGAQVEDYNGKRVIETTNAQQQAGGTLALTFLEPGLVAVGSGRGVRTAISLKNSGENVTKNLELMNLMHSLDRSDAWAIGRFDALGAAGRLPQQLAGRLPVITWFSVNGRVDSEIHGTVRGDTRDDQAANDLRDVVRGFLALAKLQAGSRPELQTLVQSLELGGTGKSVVLSFSIPGAVFDAYGRKGGEKGLAH
jgi:hypothetical protein